MVRNTTAGESAVDATGSNPPAHLLSDEKFAHLEGEQIYLFLVSQGELIWFGEWLDSTEHESFEGAIGRFLQTVDEAGHDSGVIAEEETYTPKSVTTDGWQPVQKAWTKKVPDIALLECQFHAQKRVSVTLDEFAKTHPNWSARDLEQLRDDLNSILEAPSVAAYSQRIRRNREWYEDEPLLRKRLDILKDKQILFTNHLKHEEASAYSAPLDRSMRFLDEKLQVSGQYRSANAIDPMLNAWAIVNNLRKFLPGAAKAGQSLAESFGAQFYGLPWMQVLNLCTVGTLSTIIASTA